MRNRSSIFNFDTLPERPWPSKSFFVVAATVLLSVAFVHGLGETFLVRDPNSRLANAIRYLRSQEKARPKILFLGSSRTQSCIDPETFAQESGIPCSKVLNLAQPSWGPWQALVVLRHARNALSSVETAFVELTPDSFNENTLHPITHKPSGNPEEFDAWATYPERALARDAHTQARLLAGYALPIAQRRNLTAWLGIGKQLVLRKNRSGDMSPPVYHQDTGKVALLAADPDFEATTISQYHLHDFHFSNKEATLVRRLLAFLREQGIEVVIFHPPVRAAYFDYVASDPQRQAEFEKFRSFVCDLAREHRVVYWETLEDCGLDNSAVVDYGHFSRAGAVQYTKQLYAWVHTPDQTTPSPAKKKLGISKTSLAGRP